MAKKKNKLTNTFNKLTGIVLLALTAITIVMAFLANVVYTPRLIGDASSVSGFDVMFGWASKGESISLTYASFSIMATLAYLLSLVGLILGLLFANSKILSLVPLVCYLVSAIFLFLMPSFVVYTELGEIYTAQVISLGFGAIIAGIMSCLGALWLGVKILLNLKK